MAVKRKRYISASAIAKFLQCPLAYKYIYVDTPIRLPWNMYAWYGDAIHKSLDFNYRQKIKSRKDRDRDEVIDFFKTQFKKSIAWMPAPTFQPNAAIILENDWIEMLERYMIDMAPKIQPMAIEQEFELYLESVWTYVKWYIDLITEDGYIVDHKTCSQSTHRKWNDKAVQSNYQLTMYSLAYRKMFKKAEKGVQIHKLVRGNKNNDLFFERLSTTRTDLDVLVLVQLIMRMEQMIANDIRYPNLNSCETCDFRDTCLKLSIT